MSDTFVNKYIIQDVSLGRLCLNSLIASATTTSRNPTLAPRGCKIACKHVLIFRPQLGRLPNLPGVPHLHVNSPLLGLCPYIFVFFGLAFTFSK